MQNVRLICGDQGGRYVRKLIDAETGVEIQGVEKAGVPTFGALDVVRIEATLCFTHVDVEGVPTFFVGDPTTGEMKAVARIVFADGTEFKAA